MAQIHNEIRKGTLSEAVKRALGITRGDSGIERLGETVTPIVHPWGMPEWAYLRGERLCCIWRTVGAVAAEYGYLALVNPALSEVIVVVEGASVETAAAGQGYMGFQTEAAALATLATPTPGNVRDRRNLPVTATTCYTLVGTDPSSGLGAALEIRRIAAAQNLDFVHFPIILTPGMALGINFATVNTAWNGNFLWRERQAYPGELV